MSGEKLHPFDSSGDALQVLRSISTIRKKQTILQRRRPHLLVDALVVENIESGMCTLKVSGYARGPPLNANMMVHLQGWTVRAIMSGAETSQTPSVIDTDMDCSDVEDEAGMDQFAADESFRTSPWDPKENLPDEYGKIHKFSNFKHTKKLVLTGIKKSYRFPGETTNCIPTGSYLTLHILDVPSTICGSLGENAPLVIFAILPHEEKMAVVNMVLQKHPSCKVPIKNKQNLVFQVGYRRFSARPIFSEHTNGNKFKMHRFVPAEGTFVLACLLQSCLLPLQFLFSESIQLVESA
uniref:Pre-rRNA-processing protein TSR1 homolog n=1 Tax=Ditylenchus dipsaci TaxID=166011 RepID=A0A915CSG9_9BILA